MTEPVNFAAERLRSFVERLERMQAEIDALNGDKREVYAEAKAVGFDTKVLKQVIRRRAVDTADRQEMDALLDLYERHLEGRSQNIARAPAPAPAPAPARETELPRAAEAVPKAGGSIGDDPNSWGAHGARPGKPTADAAPSDRRHECVATIATANRPAAPTHSPAGADDALGFLN